MGQLERKKIRYEALDNGFLSCSEPGKLQQICDAFGPEDIDGVFRKWLKRIPLPLRTEDRQAGYEWDLSIWQMEVSLTQIFDRPLRGRELFEEIIRDNLDLARPDRVQLIFDKDHFRYDSCHVRSHFKRQQELLQGYADSRLAIAIRLGPGNRRVNMAPGSDAAYDPFCHCRGRGQARSR
jgi:hypothetical protein